jgi:hypothetical protein
MRIAAAWPQCLGFFGTPPVIEPSPEQFSGDAGLPHAEGDDGGGPTRTPVLCSLAPEDGKGKLAPFSCPERVAAVA